MRSLSPQQGLAALERLLELRAVQTAVMPTDWHEWGGFHPHAITAPLFRNLVSRDRASHDLVSHDVAPHTLDMQQSRESIDRDTLIAAPADERRALLESFLGRQLSRVLRVPIDDLDVNQPLNNLGIDSLMAVELRNHVQANLGVVIPVAQLLEDPSIAQLARSLNRELMEPGQSESTPPVLGSGSPVLGSGTPVHEFGAVAVTDPQSANSALARLDDMSEDEVDALLNKMLK
jgi:acyl carrier protein